MDRGKNSHIYVLLYYYFANSKTNPQFSITVSF